MKTKRINKYIYNNYTIQGYYDSYYGWEDIYHAENHQDAKDRLKEYRKNEPGFSHRIVNRRECNPEWPYWK